MNETLDEIKPCDADENIIKRVFNIDTSADIYNNYEVKAVLNKTKKFMNKIINKEQVVIDGIVISITIIGD